MKLALGGGCHWCTEAVFQSLRGVGNVQQGWAKSVAPHDDWSEAVKLVVDLAVIPLETLLEIHLRTHSSMSSHSMRDKYRSAIYFVDDRAEEVLKAELHHLQAGFPQPIITEVLRLEGFKINEPAFLDYYKTDPTRPFCQTFIEPKLQMLRDKFKQNVA
ncbi:MAG: peptide-methionine (S)-S-oxide reductase [Flavobacteriales bacterium]|nr:peptide-methionine (S)-S-oxide reductase [Flavobacteriales bacterium]